MSAQLLERPCSAPDDLRELRHVWRYPYDRALCGKPREVDLADLSDHPVADAHYCAVCWHLEFGEFPA